MFENKYFFMKIQGKFFWFPIFWLILSVDTFFLKFIFSYFLNFFILQKYVLAKMSKIENSYKNSESHKKIRKLQKFYGRKQKIYLK